MPSSMPLVTATPLADTVTLLHGSDSGVTLQFPLAEVATRSKWKMQRLRYIQDRAIMPRFAYTIFEISPTNFSIGRILAQRRF